MILDSFKCEICKHVWDVSKPNIASEYNVTECPSCGYKKKDENDKTLYKTWGIGLIDVATGYLGNAKNGYSGTDVYQPSRFSTGKTFGNSSMIKTDAVNLPDSYYSGN